MTTEIRPTFRPLADSNNLWGITATSAEVVRQNYRRMAKDFLLLFPAVRLPLTLWGPVGARKTRTVEGLKQYSDERGVPYQVITIQPSTEDPTVIHGMRYTAEQDGKTLMLRAVPDVVQSIVDYGMSHYRRTDASGAVSEVSVLLGGPGHAFGDGASYELIHLGGLTIIFADEMTTCMPAQQHAMLGMLTHGKFGDMDISHLSTFIMAANPENTVSTVIELGEQVINRGGHIAWYGDVEVFLEEWTSGWGGVAKPPNDSEQWYITELLRSSPEKAFRSAKDDHEGGWTTKTLVPFHLFEHSERVTTDLGRLITLINDVFADSADDVRRYYIVEATRALMGNDWAVRMDEITRREAKRISSSGVIKQVREARVDLSSTKMDLYRLLGHSLHRLGDGSPVQRDQAEEIMAALVRKITPTSTTFSRDALVAAWAFAASAESSGQTMALHKHLVQILMDIAPRMVRQNMLDLNEAVPAFFEGTVREELKKSVASETKRRAAVAAVSSLPQQRVVETVQAPAASAPAPTPVTTAPVTPVAVLEDPVAVPAVPAVEEAVESEASVAIADEGPDDPFDEADFGSQFEEDEPEDDLDEDEVELAPSLLGSPAPQANEVLSEPAPAGLKPLTKMDSFDIFDD